MQRPQHHVGHQMPQHMPHRHRRGAPRGEDAPLGRRDLEGLEAARSCSAPPARSPPSAHSRHRPAYRPPARSRPWHSPRSCLRSRTTSRSPDDHPAAPASRPAHRSRPPASRSDTSRPAPARWRRGRAPARVDDEVRERVDIVHPELVHHRLQPPVPRLVAGGERIHVAHRLVRRPHVRPDQPDQERIDPAPSRRTCRWGCRAPPRTPPPASGPNPRPPISTTCAVQAKKPMCTPLRNTGVTIVMSCRCPVPIQGSFVM